MSMAERLAVAGRFAVRALIARAGKSSSRSEERRASSASGRAANRQRAVIEPLEQLRYLTGAGPTITSLSPLFVAFEGTAYNTTVNFTDPNAGPYSTNIDWGDGSSNLYTNVASGQVYSHTYVDGDNDYTQAVTVSDAQGGISPAVSRGVSVVNTAPSITSIVIPTTVAEGSPVTAKVNFADAGVNDTHSITIQWGDGVNQTFNNVVSGQAYTHTYANGPAAPIIDFQVKDNGSSNSLSPHAQTNFFGSNPFAVQNAAPVVATPTFFAPSIGQSGAASLSFSFTDAGINDTQSATIDWGDGTTADVISSALAGATITRSHVYSAALLPTATATTYTATVTVTDNDNGVGTKTASIHAPAPFVSSVTSTRADGSYGIGSVIPITVNFVGTVYVSGTPQLALNDGGVATYSSGSGTSSLIFTHTVAAGQSASDLDYSSTSALSGGTIADDISNDAKLTLPAPGTAGSLGANKAIVVEGIAPTLTGIDPGTATGSINTPINYTLTFSEPVNVSSLNIANTGTAGFTVGTLTGSGTNTITVPITPTSLGTLILKLNASSSVADLVGNAISGLPVTDSHTVSVNEAKSLTVTATGDGVDPFDGQTVLREAIAYANSLSTDSTIKFDSTTFPAGSLTKITLAGTALNITNTTNKVTIDGKGLVSVSGNDASQVFITDDGVNAEIDGLTITGGNAGSNGFGGAVGSGNGTLTLNNDVITGNTAGQGGGVECFGTTVTINNCTFSSNTATNGGGVYLIDSSVVITNSTFSGNSATTFGGGLVTFGYAQSRQTTVTNSTFANNSAATGAAIVNASEGADNRLVLQNSTIANNTGSGTNGVVYTARVLTAGTATTEYQGTIFSNSVTNIVTDVNGVSKSNGNNLASDGTGNLTAAGDLPGTDPLLGMLADNGGPTQTFALSANSAAIGKGVAINGITTDQRGQPRKSTPDIGAFEVQRVTPTLTVTAPGGVYNGKPFAATGSVIGLGNADLGSPTFTYYFASDTTFASPLSGPPVSAGSYVVVADFAGNASYFPVSSNTAFSITTANASFTFTGATATFDNLPHPAIFNAIGVETPVSADLTPYLVVSYKNLATNAVSTLPPVQAGTYAVLASFTGTNNYASVAQFDTGKIVVINKPSAQFGSLSTPTIIVGTASTTISGRCSSPIGIPVGYPVKITINGVTVSATIQTGGGFSAAFPTAKLGVGNYTINYAFAGSTTIGTGVATSKLVVTVQTKVLFNNTVAYKVGSTISVSFEVEDAKGVDIPSTTRTATATGIAAVANPTLIKPLPAGSSPGGAFTTSGNRSKFTLSLKTTGLTAGQYLLYFTISGDPAVHALTFILK